MNRILISICLSNLFAFIPHDFSIKGLNDMKDSLYSTISDLKKKKEELLIKMEEEKAKNG